MRISNLLQFGGLTDATILAGRAGAVNEVTSVSVLEVADAQIKNWVLPNQLYITSFYAILNDSQMQLEVVRALHEAESAGLVICHMDIFMKEVDAAIVEYCDLHRFPLIIANSATSYIEILNPILLRLAKEQTEMDETIHERLLSMIASHGEPATVYHLMCSAYEDFLVFLDINHEVLFPKFDREQHEKTNHLLQILNTDTHKRGQEPFIFTHGDKKYIFYPMQNQGLKYGSILAEVRSNGVEASLDRLKKYAIVSILLATKSARVKELRIQQKQEFMNDLITWNFRSTEVALTSAEQIGWELEGKHTLLIINLNEYVDNLQRNNLDYEKLISEVLYRKIRIIVKANSEKNHLGRRSDLFMVLTETSDADVLAGMAERILAVCKDTLAGTVSIGYSDRFEAVTDIPTAYKRAYTACMIGRRLYGKNQAVGYDEVGIYPYLEEEAVEQTVRSKGKLLFEKLIAYDAANRSQLFLTICALALNDRDIDKTAGKLFVHRNTILYRKSRAEDILGFDPLRMPYFLNTLLIAYYQRDLPL